MTDLKTELTDDPLGRGYAGMTDAEAADDLNTPRIARNRASMSRSGVMQAVEPSAYSGLTGDGLVAFWGLLSVDSLDPFGVEADVMIKLFGGGSATITALAAARVETISRAVGFYGARCTATASRSGRGSLREIVFADGYCATSAENV